MTQPIRTPVRSRGASARGSVLSCYSIRLFQETPPANHRAHAHALVIRRVTNKWLVTCYEVDNQRWYPPNRVGIRGPRRERAPASKCNLVPAHSEHAIPVLSHPGVPLWRVSPRRPQPTHLRSQSLIRRVHHLRGGRQLLVAFSRRRAGRLTPHLTRPPPGSPSAPGTGRTSPSAPSTE